MSFAHSFSSYDKTLSLQWVKLCLNTCIFFYFLCSLANQEVHVDSYGFRHKFEDQSLLLHYLCQELALHYLSQAGAYEEHQKRWTHFMRQHGKSVASHVGWWYKQWLIWSAFGQKSILVFYTGRVIRGACMKTKMKWYIKIHLREIL